jgi:ABC-type transporter Mla subunit MlaD
VIEIHVYHHLSEDSQHVLRAIHKLQELVTMNHAELLAGLNTVTTQLVKANGEIQAKLAALQAAVDAADNVPQPIVDALAALTADAQALDDIVPDAPAP